MADYKKELAKLNASQLEAVKHTEGPVLVIAGPGTGKTQLLSTRAAYILRNTHIEPKNILCLTFTDNAAFNMKQRMVDIIGEVAYKITTSTYHSFGSDLLKRFPQYFSSIISSEPIDQLLQHSIVEQIIDQLDYDNPLKKSKYYIKDVVSTIGELKSALIKPDDLRHYTKTNQEFEAVVNQHIEQCLSGVIRIGKGSIPAFNELYNLTKESHKTNKESRTVKLLSELFIDELGSAVEQAGENDTKPITAWKNDWLSKGPTGQFVLAGSEVNEKLLALADIYQSYLDTLEERGYHDFNDMILFAIDGLKNNPDFRYTLQEDFQYIMLDEFQDTNPAQMRLVELLTDNPVYEKKPNILAVGDDNQAIYAFQGADYSNIIKFKKIYRDIKTVYLTENYRSHQQILDSAENISKQIETKIKLDQERKLSSKSTIDSPSIQRLEFKSDVAQYAWVTKKISSLIKSGLNPSEISVIAPKHNLIEPLVVYLRKADIPVYYEKRENILEDQFIDQIICCTRLVLSLADHNDAIIDSLWAEVLSYDFWSIETDELWKISEQAHDNKTSWTKLVRTNRRVKPIYDFFIKLATISRAESLETMLDYITGVSALGISNKQKESFVSPFYDYNFKGVGSKSSKTEFWDLLSNLTVLRQKIRDRQSNQNKVLKLVDFIEFVDMHNSAEIKILNTSPYNEQEDSVQLMTAYGAKGLEFNTVFMLSAIDESWGPSTRNKSSNLPLSKNLKHIRYEGADDDERLRLLYVSMTRAKQRLFMTSYLSNYANKPTSRIRYFGESKDDNGIISEVLPPDNQYVVDQDFEAPKLEDLQPYWASRHIQGIKKAKLAALLKPKLDQYQLAPTHLNAFTDVVNSGPEHFYLNTILRFPSASTPDGVYGNAVHETIQWVQVQLTESGRIPTLPQWIDEFKALLSKKPLGDKELRQLSKRGEQALNNYYKMAKNEFKKDNEHEVDFKRHGVIVGNSHITGKVDKMIIDKKNREITVVDFKTGQSFDKWSSELKLHKYKQQLYFYKLLVEGSYRYSDYRVTSAYLDFIEAKSDHSRRLYLEFDEQEQQRLVQLIKAMWIRVRNLDFPDVNEYPKTLSGVKQFEDYLIKNTPLN